MDVSEAMLSILVGPAPLAGVLAWFMFRLENYLKSTQESLEKLTYAMIELKAKNN